MTERAHRLIERWRHSWGRRSLWHRHWDDLARVELTRRLGFATTVEEGERLTDELYDGTGLQAARALANAVGGWLRTEGQPWFFLKTVEDGDEATDEAKDWLADSEDRMRKAFDDPRARFRQATGEADIDLVVFGTAVVFIGELVGRDQLFFQSIWLKDAVPFFGENGNVEGMFRSRRMPLRQIIDRFTLERLSPATREKARDETKLDEKVEILFAAVPREEGRADALISRNLPVADIVIEVEAKHEIAIGGFHEMPYIVPRWDTSSGEEYGRSPGMIALPDANTSQAIGETMLVAGQRAADPPLLAPNDAFINAPHTYPGGIAGYDADAVKDLGANPIKLLEPGSNFPLTREMQNDMREQIRIAFLLNLFNLPAAGESTMTATEIIARQQEFIREMGPVFGRLETDYTAPMVERAFNIMLRADGFAPIPEALQGRGVRFEYESPVRRIREQAEAIAAREWVNDKVNIAGATGREDLLDTVNFDEYSEFTAEATGIPNRLVNGEEARAEIRQQRAEAQQAAAELAQAQAGVEIAEKVANIPGAPEAAEQALSQ